MKSYFFAPVRDPDSTASSPSSMHRLLKTNEKKKLTEETSVTGVWGHAATVWLTMSFDSGFFFKVKALFVVSLSLHTTTVAGYVTNVV